jgi:hypothetical protein
MGIVPLVLYLRSQEDFMTRVKRALSVIAIGIVSLVSAHARGYCDAYTLNGAYGRMMSGSFPQGPVASIGLVTYDGSGNFVAQDTIVLNGVVMHGTATGTYQINADCTGTQTIQIQNGPVFHADFIVVDNGKEVIFVQTDPGVTLVGTIKRL